MREAARSGLEVILVDIWEGTEPRPEVERFCDMWGIKGPILLDPGAETEADLDYRGDSSLEGDRDEERLPLAAPGRRDDRDRDEG